MERCGTAVFLLAVLCAASVESACEAPSLPLSLPQLTAVDVQDARVHVRIDTQFYVSMSMFYLSRGEESSSEIERIDTESKGPVTMSVKEDRTGYDFVLNDFDPDVVAAQLVLQFAKGCFKLSRFISIDIHGTNLTLESEPAVLYQMPDPETIVKAHEYVDIMISTKADYFYRFENRLLSWRNRTGFYYEESRSILNRDSPFKVDDFSTDAPPTSGGNRGFQTTIQFPSGMYDANFQFTYSRYNYYVEGGAAVVRHDSMQFVINYHVDYITKPEFIIHNCNRYHPNTIPPFTDRDTLVLKMEEGSQVCILVIVSGYPVPEVAAAIMSTENRIERLLQPIVTGSWTPTLNEVPFLLPALEPKGKKDLVVAIKGTNTIINQKVRLESYVDLEVSTGGRIDARKPGLVTLACTVEGAFDKLGIYMAKYWHMSQREEGEPEQWEPLKEVGRRTETANVTYSTQVEITDALVNRIMDDYMGIFCAARDAHQHTARFFKFDFARNKTDEYADWY